MSSSSICLVLFNMSSTNLGLIKMCFKKDLKVFNCLVILLGVPTSLLLVDDAAELVLVDEVALFLGFAVITTELVLVDAVALLLGFAVITTELSYNIQVDLKPVVAGCLDQHAHNTTEDICFLVLVLDVGVFLDHYGRS